MENVTISYDDGTTESREDFDGVSVVFADADDDYHPMTCDNGCGVAVDSEGADGDDDRCSEADCLACEGTGRCECVGSVEPEHNPHRVCDDDGDCRTCEGTGYGPHAPVPAAIESWCNHAGVTVYPGDDRVSVHISVGDPRGAFTMEIRRIPVDADSEHAGRLVLYVPHADMSSPHVGLTELRPGALLLGG